MACTLASEHAVLARSGFRCSRREFSGRTRVDPVARADARWHRARGGHSQAVAEVHEARVAGGHRRGLFIARRRQRARVPAQPARSGRDRDRDRSGERQDRVAAEVPGRLYQEPVRDRDGQGAELDAARRRRPAVHSRCDRNPHGVERRRRHDCLAAGLFSRRSTRRNCSAARRCRR